MNMISALILVIIAAMAVFFLSAGWEEIPTTTTNVSATIPALTTVLPYVAVLLFFVMVIVGIVSLLR